MREPTCPEEEFGPLQNYDFSVNCPFCNNKRNDLQDLKQHLLLECQDFMELK